MTRRRCRLHGDAAGKIGTLTARTESLAEKMGMSAECTETLTIHMESRTIHMETLSVRMESLADWDCFGRFASSQ